MDENKTQPNEKDIKVLRTYTSDMADAIRTNEASVIKIALAEKEKREQEEVFEKAEGTPLGKTFLVIGGIIFIVAALFGSYYLFQKKKENEILPTVNTNIVTFISYDSFKKVDVSNATNTDDLVGILENVSFEKTGLINILFLEKNVSEVKQLLTSQNFLSLIKSGAPGALVRSLKEEFLFGKFENKGSFLIFETLNYNQTYASMLTWEKTLVKDLLPIYKINIPEGNETLFEQEWKDIIINNRDARVFYGLEGQGILYYLFINKDHLLITDNIDALKEITGRLLMKR